MRRVHLLKSHLLRTSVLSLPKCGSESGLDKKKEETLRDNVTLKFPEVGTVASGNFGSQL